MKILLACTSAFVLAWSAHAATPPSQSSYAVNLGLSAFGVPAVVPGGIPLWIDTTNTAVNSFGLPTPTSDQSPFPVLVKSAVSDANSAAFQGAVAMTAGTPYPAQRSIGFVCTAAGSVTLTLVDGSTMTFGIVASPALQTLPLAVTQVALGGGAAGTFWNLK